MDNQAIYDRHITRVVELDRYLKSRYHYGLIHALFALLFVVNFILGRLIHWFSPDAEVYSFYTDKRNIINQLMVKRGWGWTTVISVAHFGVNHGKKPHKRLVPFIIRYTIMTIWWILFTQWCFGLPLMDRIFVWTGGRCQFDLETAEVLPLAIKQTIETGASHSLQLSSYHCKRHKGQWVGGHDPSGHVFLLVHSSLFMFFEFIPFRAGVNQISQWFVMGLIGLWWFMLLMTNVYFHSITEKVVGLLFGYFAVAWVYVVSPAIALRSIKRPPSRKLDYN